MQRLAISVEGPTEREFVKQVLEVHLLQVGWDVVKAVSLNGGVSVGRVRDEVRRLATNFECVSTLYDYYGFGGRGTKTVSQLEQELQQAVGAVPRFIPYLQKYEFEALLFSGPVAVAEAMRKPELRNLFAAAVPFGGCPEDINDGHDTCPSRRLKSVFPEYEKLRHGPVVTAKIGLPQIANACPRFRIWVDALVPIV